MNKIKIFTQSITKILLWTMIISFLYLTSQLLEILGVIQFIDSQFYTNLRLFLVFLVSSRAGYAVGSFLILYKIAHMLTEKEFFCFQFNNMLTEMEFFWFKKESSYHLKLGKDKSGMIIALLLVIAAASFGAEVVIRVCTLTLPPFFIAQ